MYEGNYGGIVTVNGNLNYNSTRSTTRTNYVNNKPVYRVKGNIIQGADTGDFIISNIELTGTNQQVILQANSDVESLKAGNGTLTVGEYFNILHLKSDMAPKTAATTLKTNVKVSLEGYTLTIDKNLENNGVIVTNTKGKLIVKGNIVSNKGLGIHESGSLQVGGSYTQVKEDFNIGKDARIEIGGDLNLEDQGYIYEDSYGGIVTINGNINYNSNHEARRTSYVNNKPIYIVKGDVIQAADAGEFNVGTVRLEKDGAKVNVSKGKIDILEVYHSKNRYTITESCYNTLKVICDIKLDANGGTMDAKTLVVKTGDKIGELPTPTRQGYDFIGWYTNNIAGDQVKAGDVSKFLEDTTLWAHWKGQDNTQIRAFVNRLYQILLDREAEPAGLEDWTNRLASGTANAAQIVEGIVNSQEFANKNLSYEDVVERMYQSMLGRASDEGGKSNWTNKLNNGLSANSIINGFSGSVEFGNLCSNYGIQAGSIKLSEPRDQNEGISAFVARCYEKALGRAYEKDGLNYWCKNILDDGNKKQKAEEVASNGFFHSEEFGNKNTSNEEYVEILYRTFLGREYDETGKADWVGKLNSGVSRDEVLYGFSRSQEFSNIMATYGL